MSREPEGDVVTEPARIHLGSGPVRLEGWVNVDLEPATRPDVVADLGQPFPFRDACASVIHAEGVMCQLPLDRAYGFLRECRRLLVPGGRVRLLTPDLTRFVRAYLDDYESGGRALVDLWYHGTGLPLRTETACEVLNVGLRDYHAFMYDDRMLPVMARECGFEPVQVDFRQSGVAELRDIDQRSRDDALYQYFELVKPRT